MTRLANAPTATDRQIDTLVDELYGLTDDEKKIIEELDELETNADMTGIAASFAEATLCPECGHVYRDVKTLRTCLKTPARVAHATGLCRWATRPAEREWAFELIMTGERSMLPPGSVRRVACATHFSNRL